MGYSFFFRLDPFVVFLDEVHEAFHGLGFGDVELDGLSCRRKG